MMLPQVFGLDPRPLPAGRDGQGVGRPRSGLGPLRGARPDRRRPAHRPRRGRDRLALDLPHQHPRRRVRAARRPSVPADVPVERSRPPRRPRLAGRRRRGHARLPAGRGPRARLAGLGARHARPVGARARGVRAAPVAAQGRGEATLVEPSIFRNRSYVSGVAFAMVCLGAMGGLMAGGGGAAADRPRLLADSRRASRPRRRTRSASSPARRSAVRRWRGSAGPSCTRAWSSRPSAWSRCSPCSSCRAGRRAHFHFAAPLPRGRRRAWGWSSSRSSTSSPRAWRTTRSARRRPVPGAAAARHVGRRRRARHAVLRLVGSHVDEAGFVAAASHGPRHVALLAAAFAIAFGLPRHARHQIVDMP